MQIKLTHNHVPYYFEIKPSASAVEDLGQILEVLTNKELKLFFTTMDNIALLETAPDQEPCIRCGYPMTDDNCDWNAERTGTGVKYTCFECY